jgi:hypothetical protein
MRSYADALGLPRLGGKRRAVPHVTHVDATANESVVCRLDIGDGELALGRAGCRRCESLAERDRGPRSWGCELDDAEPVERCDVIVEPLAKQPRAARLIASDAGWI